MSRVMYLDCFSGAAGDMLLGAMLDAGLPLDALQHALGTLGVGHELHAERVLRGGISATHVRLVAGPHHHHEDQPHGHHHHDHSHHHEGHAGGHSHEHRSLAEITTLIGQSSLSTAGKTRAVELFRRIGEAEAAIHNMSIDEVHLHEVGAVDSIIDIVGVVFAFEWFGIDDIVASPLNVGGGTVEIAHGVFPVPAPATLRLLDRTPVYSTGIQAELVTPTGALLVTSYAREFGPMPAMVSERVGYGAGTRDLGRVPNVLRVVIGERTDAVIGAQGSDRVVKLECEIDDMSPQLFGPVSDLLFTVGALDVFLTPVQMKKGRPGTLLTILAPPGKRERICDVVFRETTTLGIRFQQIDRETLERRTVDVTINGGRVAIKLGLRRGEVVNAVPEFDDCVRIAGATGRPVKIVQAEALRAWFDQK